MDQRNIIQFPNPPPNMDSKWGDAQGIRSPEYISNSVCDGGNVTSPGSVFCRKTCNGNAEMCEVLTKRVEDSEIQISTIRKQNEEKCEEIKIMKRKEIYLMEMLDKYILETKDKCLEAKLKEIREHHGDSNEEEVKRVDDITEKNILYVEEVQIENSKLKSKLQKIEESNENIAALKEQIYILEGKQLVAEARLQTEGEKVIELENKLMESQSSLEAVEIIKRKQILKIADLESNVRIEKRCTNTLTEKIDKLKKDLKEKDNILKGLAIKINNDKQLFRDLNTRIEEMEKIKNNEAEKCVSGKLDQDVVEYNTTFTQTDEVPSVKELELSHQLNQVKQDLRDRIEDYDLKIHTFSKEMKQKEEEVTDVKARLEQIESDREINLIPELEKYKKIAEDLQVKTNESIKHFENIVVTKNETIEDLKVKIDEQAGKITALQYSEKEMIKTKREFEDSAKENTKTGCSSLKNKMLKRKIENHPTPESSKKKKSTEDTVDDKYERMKVLFIENSKKINEQRDCQRCSKEDTCAKCIKFVKQKLSSFKSKVLKEMSDFMQLEQREVLKFFMATLSEVCNLKLNDISS